MRHRPRKRFGQNFLIDGAVISEIVDAIYPRRDERLVEIGPGLGALTRPLLERLDHLHVIEIDRDLVSRLRADFPLARVTVHERDALTFDFATLGSGLRVVGNLPYNISTPLLFHLAQSASSIRDIHVMLQREVVERMVARPSSSDYGRLSVMIQYRFQLEPLMTIPATAFRPVPKVESAVVRMVPFGRLPHCARDEAWLGRIVTAAFSQRRKTLRNALKGYIGADDFSRLGVDANLRPQDLAIAEFVRLADFASRNAPGGSPAHSLISVTRKKPAPGD
jgi:16S rRNA (adenine1518-N6/adenine1519-N6)-dimethyltransferase